MTNLELVVLGMFISLGILLIFPILLTLLVTFGVATTFLGFERLVTDIAFINERPFLMLIVGLGILTITGTLYKKLG